MAKKTGFRVILVWILLLLLLAAGIYYFFMPKSAAKLPEFQPMPMDTAGGNLIGNLPENLEAGGFMAGQSGWLYFANFSDGGALYMCREGGSDMTKITNFPVCNINVLGTSLVFTSHERYDEYGGGADSPIGGKLYAIYGISSADKPILRAIDSDTAYFSPYLDRDGLYAAYSESNYSVIVNKFYDTKIVIPREKGSLRKIFSSGDKIYAELSEDANSANSIMRIDAKTLLPLDYINGAKLNRIGKSFVFSGGDEFIYELVPASGEIKPISSLPLHTLEVNQFGEIKSFDTEVYTAAVTISKEQRYKGIVQTLMSRRESKPITLLNGWYSYFNEIPRHADAPTYFKANDKYFYINGSAWSESWLNVKLDSEPLVSLDNLVSEDTFTPPWIDFSEKIEPINPASDEDFGSERAATPDIRTDASADAAAALDATILLLCGDESIADKYTGESVEKLKNRYGGALDAAISTAADELSDAVSAQFGISLDIEELRDIVIAWLKPSYSIGDAKVSSDGGEAAVKLTVMSAPDLNLLYTVFQNELTAHTEEDPVLLQMDAYEQSAWRTSLLAEIMRNPDSYDYKNNRLAELQVYMAYSDCWVTDNPAALIGGLIPTK